MIMSNEKLAVLWHEVGPYHKRKIESILIETNKRFLLGFLRERRPPIDYYEILLNALRSSVKPALERFEPIKGLKFISYWVWWMRNYYNNTLLKEFTVFPIGTTPIRIISEDGKTKRIKRDCPKSVPIDAPISNDNDFTLADKIGFTPEPYEHDIKNLIIKRYQGKERQIFLMLADGITQKVISAKVNLSTNRIRLTIAKERQALRRLVLQGF